MIFLDSQNRKFAQDPQPEFREERKITFPTLKKGKYSPPLSSKIFLDTGIFYLQPKIFPKIPIPILPQETKRSHRYDNDCYIYEEFSQILPSKMLPSN